MPQDALHGEVMPSGLISRRTFIRNGSLGVAALALPSVLAGSAWAADGVGGTVNYLGWEGEDFKKPLAGRLAAHKLKFKSTYMASMGDLASKFAAGGGKGIDLLDYSSNGTARLVSARVPFAALDLSKIPNRKGLTPFFRDDPQKNFVNADGDVIGIPIAWGAMGMTYNSKKVAAPGAWADLLQPKFKNKLTILDDPSTTFGIASAILGLKPDKLDERQFEQVKAYLAKIVGQAKQITPSFGDMANLLASGEIDVGWGGYAAVNGFAAAAGNKNIKTSSPQKGRCGFVEIWGLSEKADNPDSVYALMNDVLDPKINAACADAIVCAPTVGAAFKHIDKATAAAYPLAKQTAFLKTFVLTQDPLLSSGKYATYGDFTDAWTEIKSGKS